MTTVMSEAERHLAIPVVSRLMIPVMLLSPVVATYGTYDPDWLRRSDPIRFC